MQGLTLPAERNIRRPVVPEDHRYQRTLSQADTDPTGRLACLLALARQMGRRVDALYKEALGFLQLDISITVDVVSWCDRNLFNRSDRYYTAVSRPL